MTATLSSGLTQGVSYSTLSVTSMPVTVPSGVGVFVSQGLTNVEAFTTSAPVALHDTTIHVVTKVAAHSHAVGQNVMPAYLMTAVGRTLTPIEVPRTRRL